MHYRNTLAIYLDLLSDFTLLHTAGYKFKLDRFSGTALTHNVGRKIVAVTKIS